MNLNRNTKNRELLIIPEVKAHLNAGHVVVIEISNTQNDAYKSLFLAQQVEGAGSSVTDAQALLLGWNKQIERCVANAGKDQAETLKPGDSLNEKFGADFCIQIVDTYEPNPNFDHSPRASVDQETGEIEYLVCKETGKDVYRHTTLVTRNTLKNSIKRVVAKSKFVPPVESTSIESVLKQAQS